MNKKGFTLIEIIIVIVILGVLASLAVPKITGQMEATRGSEAMQFFGTLRRAATDCLAMANGTAASCVTMGQLGVSMPTTGQGASFSYSAAADSPAANQIQFKATRTVGGVANAICMVVTGDGAGSVTSVAYGVTPATSPFASIVNRANSSVGIAADGCANATALATALQ
ncbi:MAG: prepilin-type N-terminal cleavage/methylation domain-containing protein [Candidatus Omnitrophica bacterium]|nr:prepilin-type N-terminal cleavage/methylation domain-containing protein [Candidatus Omnitrophota bacterium]